MGTKRSGGNNGGRGGYGSMQYARCPECNLNKKSGYQQITSGDPRCIDRTKCAIRRVRWLKTKQNMKGLTRDELDALREGLLAKNGTLLGQLVQAARPLTPNQWARFVMAYVKGIDLRGCGKVETASELMRHLLGIRPFSSNRDDSPHLPVEAEVAAVLAAVAKRIEQEQKGRTERLATKARRRFR